MTRPRWRVGAELLPVLLVLACMAGSLAAVISAYRRPPAAPESAPAPAPVQVASPRPATPPPDPTPAAEPAEDPTPKALARLAAEAAEQARAAGQADRRAEGLERARRAAEEDVQRRQRREALARAQVDAMEAKAQRLETEAETLALERDVLARRRDDAKAALARARARASSSFAVLPYKGPTGTWQRPIPIECHDGQVTLRPDGPSFSMVELSGLPSYRSSPFVAAIAREMLRAENAPTPDGAPSVPYILFIVRPDGIRPYYEARTRLEPLGITFGYELVEQDWEVDYPDLDDPSEWDDGSSPRPGTGAAPRWPLTASGTGRSGADGTPIWPASPPAGGRPSGWESPSALERALNGPGTRLGSGYRPGRSIDDESPAPGDAQRGDLPPSARPPASPRGGRVEIVPRGSSRRPGTSPAPFNRWAPLDEVVPEVASGGSEGQTGPRRDGAPPGWPGRPDREPASLGSPGRPGDASGGASPPLPSRSFADARPPTAGGIGLPSPTRPEGSETGGVPGGDPRGGLPGGLPGPATEDQAPGAGGTPAPSSPGSSERPRLPERVLEMVVVCGPQGVTIQPGGYRLGLASLQAGDDYLLKQLRSVIRLRRQAEPKVFWMPRLRFLVEPGGEATYREVREQTILANTGWPITLQVAEAERLRVFQQERK